MYIVLVLVVLLLIVFVGIVAICWYFSNRLLYRAGGPAPYNILVRESNADTITLQRTKNTGRPGVFGVRGTDGQAIVGPILSFDAGTVTRRIIHSTGSIAARTKVAWNTTVYGGELRDRLGLEIKELSFPGSLGNLPAWFVPGKRDVWAILVHGSTGTREQGLRVFPTLADLALPILAITYRGDEGVPSGPGGLSHLGESEWEDLEAAVRYALAQGARRVLLYGWSMGGSIVEVFLRRSSYAHIVQAVVLDSPVLSWRATLACLARKNRLPSFIARITERVIIMRTGIHRDVLDLTNRSTAHIPTLLFHGTEDTTAPITVSDAFAATHAISYHRVPGAEHTQCWNANHEKYEAELRSFLLNVLDASR